MKSRYFSGLAIRAFNRVGDILIPGNGDFPSFSEYGGVEHLDKAAAFAPPDDMRSLNLLMSLLSLAPNFVLRWLVQRAADSHRSTGPLSPLFRKLYYGWWGLLFGCYYSQRPGENFHGKDPVDIIQFRLRRVRD
jgi:hypothetical protein